MPHPPSCPRAPRTAVESAVSEPPTCLPSPATLGALLRQAAERWPTWPALEAAGRVWRYEQLTEAVDAAAGMLAARGVGPGDRIAVALGHGAAHLAVPFVASRLGVSALLLRTARDPERWRWQLQAARPRLLLAHGPRAAALAGHDIDVCDVDGTDPSFGASPRPEGVAEPHGHGPSSTLLYVGTSGTTGRPKLTCLTEGGLLHAARGYLRRLPLEEGERSLVVMPLHYIGPITAQSVLMPMLGGCSVIAADPRPGPVAERLATDPVTHLDAVPAWLNRLPSRLLSQPRAWRTVIYGGAPMPPATAAALAARVPGLGLYDVWGLSEAHGPVTLRRHNPADPPAPGVVGSPLPGLTVRAVPEGQVPVVGPPAPPGEQAGELWVAGPSITPGYLDDPQATASALHDGWLATGDLGAVDRDGTVRVLGRRKDVILRGGVTVFSVEVEQVLGAVPGVSEAAVFPVPSDSAGEAVGAAVVATAGGIDAGALRRTVRQRIGPHAVPWRVVVVDELPRNPTGKVDKQALARRVAGAATDA